MLTIFHTNDLHGMLDDAMAARLAEWKHEAGEGAVFFDSGDCIRAGNLAIPVRTEAAWRRLSDAGCDAGTLGNRESHPLASAFRAKLAGHVHPIVVANLREKGGGLPFPGSIVLERAGHRIGVIGAMVPMVTERMASKAASTYLWDPPIPAVVALARDLRPQVDCLVALTHIGYRQDVELAKNCPDLDLILGGHSHTVLPEPDQVGQTFICQGGSHARFVGIYAWAGRGQKPQTELRPLQGA